MTVETRLMTFVEFEQLPDPPSGHYELHHGQLIHMPPGKKPHFAIQQAIYDLLLPLLRTSGQLGVEFPFRPGLEYEAWQADVAFVSADRWQADDNDYFLGAPDLVIEVLSKSNTLDEILDRQATCFSAGCISFWIVDVRRKMIMVTNPDGITMRYQNSVIPLWGSYPGTVDVVKVFESLRW